MSAADIALQRAHAYLNDYRDSSTDTARFEALDAARLALLDARRARAPTSHLIPLFTGICSAAASDPSHQVRTVLLQACEDNCLRDMRSFAPAATSFLIRALHDDHIIVATRGVRALTTLFRKLLGFSVSIGVGEGGGLFKEAALAVWLKMQQKAVSFIHAQDEGLRKAAIKFAETVVLALSFSGSAGSPDHFTLDFLLKKGSQSPLLDPRVLEEEGIECVKSIGRLMLESIEGKVLTVKPNGAEPVSGLPPASFMTAISVLGNLVRRRRKIIEFTLPPFLNAVAALVAAGNGVTNAMQRLSDGQKLSITAVLRFNISALRPYPHTRSGRVGADIAQATNDLANYEKVEEERRKQKAALAKEHAEKVARANFAKTENRRIPANMPFPPSAKRPRTHEPPLPWPRLPPKDAYALSQHIIQSMPPQEVVNFIMTRLLLNIPPVETILGAQRASKRPSTSSRSAAQEPVQKKPRSSRFAAKDSSRQASEASPAPMKKVAVVRKVAPPVVPARLSASARQKIVIICCRRILRMENRAISSGTGPLRIQLLARLLTKFAQTDGEIYANFCKEACEFIVGDFPRNISIAQAWLTSLICDGELRASAHLTTLNGHAHVGTPGDMKIKVDVQETKLVDGNEPMHEEFKPEPEKGVGTDKKETPKDEEPALTVERGTFGQLENGSHEHTSDSIEKGDNPGNAMKVSIAGEKPNLRKEPQEAVTCGPEQVDETCNQSQQKTVDVEMGREEEEEDEHEPLVRNTAYDNIFGRVLKLIFQKYPDADDLHSMFLVDAPVIPFDTWDTLREACKDPSRMKLGLYILREIVLKRPGGDRWSALSMLFEFCRSDDEALKGPAIRLVANKIFSESVGELPDAIEKHAEEVLRDTAQSLSCSSDASDINRLQRDSMLLTALCGQKPALLTKLAGQYLNAPREAKGVLLSRARELAGHLGIATPPFIQLIRAKLVDTKAVEGSPAKQSDGLEDMALEMLRAVVKKYGKPPKDIVQAAQERYECSGDISFIKAVLSGLEKEALLRYLKPLVSESFPSPEKAASGEEAEKRDDGSKTAGFKETIGSIMSNRSPALSAAELLIELHNIPPSAAVSNAIRACFELKSVYKQEAIAQALEQLISKTVVPDLFMRTVHLARIFFPEMEKYLTGTVMIQLNEKKVWKNEVVWEGYLRYCAEVKERSLKILLSLPVSQLADALERQEALRTVFRELIANPKNKKVRIKGQHKNVIQAALSKHRDKAS